MGLADWWWCVFWLFVSHLVFGFFCQVPIELLGSVLIKSNQIESIINDDDDHGKIKSEFFFLTLKAKQKNGTFNQIENQKKTSNPFVFCWGFKSEMNW